jgi:hypothetical protein
MKRLVMTVILGGLCVFILSGAVLAQDPKSVWVRQAGGEEIDAGYGIAVDGWGNSLVTGTFSGTADFGPGTSPLFSRGGFDLFVIRYDEDGKPLWVRQGGGPGRDEGLAAAVDGMGNGIVAGRFSGTADNPALFGSITLASAGGSTDIFIAKYDTQGNVAWVKQAGGRGEDQAFGLATDGVGNILITGRFRGPTNDPSVFGSFQLFSAGGSADAFVAKYDPDGNALWVKQAGGIDHDEGQNIAADPLGNIYVTGRFRGQANFDAVVLVSEDGSDDVFVAKYDRNGNLLWAEKGGGSGQDSGSGVTVDAFGHAVITGYYEETAAFGTEALTAKGAADLFVVKYDGEGDLLWARSAGGNGDDGGQGIATDRSGHIMVTGYYHRFADFGTMQLSTPNGGTSDIFIARYDPAGKLMWLEGLGGPEADSGRDLAINALGQGYVVGTFRNMALLGTYPLFTSAGEEDAFALKIGLPFGDINGNGKIGLEEAIYALQVMSRMRPR